MTSSATHPTGLLAALLAAGTEASLLVSLLYGGIHHALLLLAVAVGTLGVISIVVVPLLVAGSYPEPLGPVLTFIGRGSLSLWLVAVGVGLDRAGRRLES